MLFTEAFSATRYAVFDFRDSNSAKVFEAVCILLSAKLLLLKGIVIAKSRVIEYIVFYYSAKSLKQKNYKHMEITKCYIVNWQRLVLVGRRNGFL